MDIRTTAALITGIAALILLLLKLKRLLQCRKRKQKQKQKPEQVKSSSVNRKQFSGCNMPQAVTAGKAPLPAEEPHGCERTMLLTYTTLILKDTQRPIRLYKADLLRPVLIGRSDDNDIVLEDESVSRRHLRVFRMGALVYAENLSRINGTLLNGRLLTEPKEIVTGSRLQLGKQSFLVEID